MSARATLLLLAVPTAALHVAVGHLGKLKLPIYAAEHLLVLAEASSEGSRFLPVLLSPSDGACLEQAMREGEPRGRLAVAADLIARRDFFEAAAQAEVSVWSVAQMADGKRPVSAVMADHLAACGYTALDVLVGAASAPAFGAVRTRDLGAFTGPQPTAVSLGELPASMRLREGATGREATVPLPGAGDAVLLARRGALPLLVPDGVWEERAVAAEKLPDLYDDSVVRFGS